MIELRDPDVNEESSPFSVYDYVQIAGMGRRTVRIEVTIDGGEGSILVREGQLWSANVDTRTGMEALRAMVQSQECQVRCVVDTRDWEPQNLPETSYEHVLLELARNLDDEARGHDPSEDDDEGSDIEWGFEEAEPEAHEPEPRLHVVPSFTPPPPPRRSLDSLLDDGAEALLDKDYPRALTAFEAALEFKPSHGLAKANAKRLRVLIELRQPREA